MGSSLDFCALPGSRQTVPRAELYAIVVAVENVDPEEELTIISDSELNIKLYHKGKGATRKAANLDFW